MVRKVARFVIDLARTAAVASFLLAALCAAGFFSALWINLLFGVVFAFSGAGYWRQTRRLRRLLPFAEERLNRDLRDLVPLLLFVNFVLVALLAASVSGVLGRGLPAVTLLFKW